LWCQWLLIFSFSVDHSARVCAGGRSNGGKSVDNGLDERGGDVLVTPFDWISGDKRQFVVVVVDGGVRGIHMGASGDKDDDGLANNGIGRFTERARITMIK